MPDLLLSPVDVAWLRGFHVTPGTPSEREKLLAARDEYGILMQRLFDAQEARALAERRAKVFCVLMFVALAGMAFFAGMWSRVAW